MSCRLNTINMARERNCAAFLEGVPRREDRKKTLEKSRVFLKSNNYVNR